MEDKITRWLSLAAALLMGISVGFVVTYASLSRYLTFASGNAAVNTAETSTETGTDKYTEIMKIIDQYYIGDDVDETTLDDGMAEGIIAALGDRWSYYVSASNYQEYQDGINNAYVGVGITISPCYDEEENLTGYEVISVTEGGPAEEAGVQEGDILTAVDGTSILDLSLSETKKLVRGAEGTKVALSFTRGDAQLVIPVERQSFTVVPASGYLMEDSVGYIQIDNFETGCADAVKSLVEELQAEGATSLLFDVRNNPGGLKTELTSLLDYLLPEGTIFHSVDYTGAEEIVSSDASCVDLPMAVLVNGNSYSAAEYFACALQEYGVAKVIGEKTCGKGYYQVGISLSDGSCLNLSVGKYYTPSGISLIDVGVTPDIELALDDDLTAQLNSGTLDAEDDPQIQAALGCLK